MVSLHGGNDLAEMKTVITYGTYDLLHQGHINLLRRAKELGDYLIVGVTNDRFDIDRGKLNVRNNVLERVEAVKATGFADKIIIEDYVGQKIDDIQKYDVDIFAIGSDWEGKFDYLNEYCNVVYLPRTEGISSTMLREESQNEVKVGIIGCGRIAKKFVMEAPYVSGVKITTVYDVDFVKSVQFALEHNIPEVKESLEEILDSIDAVYIATPNTSNYELIKESIKKGKHVLCENAMVTDYGQAKELYSLAEQSRLVLLEGIKTAYIPAFGHLITMIKSGLIGDVVDIDASVSILKTDSKIRELNPVLGGGCMYEMGSYPLLPILKLLGTEYKSLELYCKMQDGVDVYTRGMMRFDSAICSFKLGMNVKTEGNLIISGTKGYAYVPAPWWKMDYYELRYEDQNENKKFFYKLDGEGLRYEIQEFVSCIVNKRISSAKLRRKESIVIAKAMAQYKAQITVKDI